jgi:hypothetical protein
MLSIEPIGDFVQWKGGELEVVLCDDRAFVGVDCLRGTAIVERIDFLGRVRARAEVALVPHAEAGLAPATSRARIPAQLLATDGSAGELLVARFAGDPALAEATWFLADDAELALPAPGLVHLGGGVHRAACVVREFWIEEPAGDAVDSWRTLLPGQEVLLAEGARWWSANHFARARA